LFWYDTDVPPWTSQGITKTGPPEATTKSITDTLIFKSHQEELLQHFFMEIMLKVSGLPFGAVPALPIAAKRLNFFFNDRCSQL
jgi:hypothetical protein